MVLITSASAKDLFKPWWHVQMELAVCSLEWRLEYMFIVEEKLEE
jgi:hypothetical protein